MARQIINVGTGPDTHTGEPIRSAWQKTNANFAELYSLTSNIANVSANTGNIIFSAQTISGQLADTDITIEPDGVGKVSIVGNLVTSHLRFLGNTISTQYAGELVLDASAGNIKLNDPLKFSDGTVQYSAAVGNAGTVNTLTVTNLSSSNSIATSATIATLTGTTATYTTYRFANGNSILANISTAGFTGSYSDLTNKPTIPTHTGNLTNDSGFITSAYVTWSNVSAKPTFATVATSGDYSDLLNRPSLGNYATFSYVDSAVANLVANAPGTLDTLREIADSMGNLTSIIDYIDNSVANATPNLASYAGNIVPSANVTYNLGSASYQWNDLYLSNATIYMNGVPLSLSAGNILSVNGEAILSNNSDTNITTTGNVTANDVSADGWVYGNLGVETQQVQFTDPFGFSLDSVNLLLSDGKLVYESTAGTNGGFVPSADDSETIGRSDRQWSTIYGNSIYANVFYGNGSQLTGITSLGNLTVNDYNIYNTNGQGVIISNFSFVDEAETAYVQIPAGNSTADLNVVQEQGNVRLVANAAVWTFGTDNKLTAPGEVYGQYFSLRGGEASGTIGSLGYGGNIIDLYGVNGVTISTVTEGGPQWQFGTDGNLSVPQNINFSGGGLRQVVNEDFYVRVSDDESDGWSLYNVVDDGAGNDLTQTRLEYNQFSVRTNIQGATSHTWQFNDSGTLGLPGNIAGNYGGNLFVSIGDQPGSDTFIDLRTISYVGDALISNIRISNPNVTISTASGGNTWTFDSTGNLTIPGNFIVNSMASPAPTMSGFSSASFIDSLRVDQLRLIDNAITTVNGSSNIILNAQYGSATDSFVQIPTFQDGGEQLVIKNAYNSSLGIRLQTETGNFTFSGTSLTFPDSTTQTTAYTGSTYSDSDVTTLLASLGSNAISSTGNVTGGNLTTTGTANIGTLVITGTSTTTGNVTTTANITAGYFIGDGSQLTGINVGTGNITFSDTTISTGANVGQGIILNSSGSGEIALMDYTGINNTNPGYWLHVGDGSLGATENTGNISIDFNNGNNSSRGTAILDWAWWDGTKGTNDRGTGVHTHFGIYKNDSTYTTEYIEFDYTSGNATVGNVTANSVTTSGIITTTGNITGGNLTTTGTTTLGNTATVTTSNYQIGYRDIPQVTLSANVTAALTDAGKHFYSTTAGNLSILIPTNANVAFPVGTAFTVVVQAAGNVLVNADTGVTLYMAGNSTSSSRVISTYGMATVMKVATNTWFINGTGVA